MASSRPRRRAAPHVRNPRSAPTWSAACTPCAGCPRTELIDLLRAAIEARRAALQADPPKAGDDVLGVMGNPVPADRSLPIRVFDLWAHEQDVRIAIGRPGNEDGPAAGSAATRS